MQEHNFEKQVQQKMDELSITPSAPVWQKVEQEIRKKKDRRRIAFWLVPLLLIGGGLTWWAVRTPERAPVAAAQTNQQAPKPINSHKPPLPAAADNAELPANGSIATVTEHEIGSGPVALTQSTPNRNRPSPPVRAKVFPAETKSTWQPPDPTNDHSRVDEETPIQTAGTEQATLQPPAESSFDSIHREEAASSPLDKRVSGEKKQPQSQEETPDSLSVVNNKVKKKNEKNWEWNIHASAGISSVKKGLFYSNTMTLDYFRAPSTGGVPAPPPSEVRKGTAYSFGVALKRKTNERLSFTGGIQYHLFSTRTATGAQITRDTVVNNNASYRNLSSYYQTGGQKEYKNNYHFIELPVGIEYQPFKKLPLRLHTGLVLGRLVSTNALVYDRWNNIYYKDNSVLNKTQWQVFATLNYKLIQTGKSSLHLGPYLQYGFQGLEKEEQVKKYHLFSAGLRTHISF